MLSIKHKSQAFIALQDYYVDVTFVELDEFGGFVGKGSELSNKRQELNSGVSIFQSPLELS